MLKPRPAPKKSRNRSPNHPYISLKRAVELARKIYDTNKTHLVPSAVAHKVWKYSEGSSTGDQCIAALKSYGLVHAATNTKDGSRQIQVSARGHKIVVGALDAADMLKKAALEPPIHKELWEKYEGDLPSDDVIRHYLLFEREGGHFNDDVVDAFIARFREALEVAKLGRCDIIEGGAGVETGDESMRPAEDGPKAGPEAQQMGTTPTTNALPLPVLMDNGTFQVVSIPKMTRSAFDFFKRQLEAYAAAIILPDGKDATEAPADAGD